MKTTRGVALVLALCLAGSLHWAGRRAAGAGTAVPAAPPPAPPAPLAREVRPPPPPASEDLSPEREREAERVRRLVAGMQDLMRRSEGLSSDNIDEFELRSNLTNEFANGLDLEKASLLVRHMPAGFLATPWGDIALRRWAREDRLAAAAWMAANPDPSPVAATALMHGWFAADRAAARDYVKTLPAGAWKTHVATSTAEEALVAEEPAALIDLLALAPGANPRREELQEWAAIMWGKNNYTEALAWASGAGDVNRRERLVAAVSVGYANTDPLVAAEDLLARVKSADIAAPALGSIVRIWSAKEPVAAAQWVASFPAGPEKARAVEQLIEVWAHGDASAAKAWADALDDEASSAAAAQVLAKIDAERAP